MKVIVVHGIKRSNRWYEDLQAMEVVKQERIKIIPYDYGHFSGKKFIRKKKRQEIVDGFVTFYNSQISSNEAPPSVIAHSFGTAVVFHAMKQYDVIKFDNIILCGSILSSKIDLRPYCESNQFNKIINDHGSREWFVGYTRLLSKEYGNLGEVGFKDVPPQFKNRITNRASHKRHSDYFMPLSMQKNWINELIKSRAIQDFNIMILRKEVIDRLYLRSFQSDTPFEINSIRFNARIDVDGNYYAKYDFDGLNDTNIALESYNFATAADGIHDLNTMNFRVYDRDNNLLEFEEVEDYNHKKTIKIRLLNPVKKKASINHKLYFCWYKTINLKSGDTDHWNIMDITNCRVQLNFPNSLKSPKFYVVKDYEIVEKISPSSDLELDNSYTYSLNYDNSNNADGLIFYFEGIENRQRKHKSYKPFRPKSIRIGRKSVLHIEKAKPEHLPKIYKVESEIELGNSATEEILRQRLLMFNDGFLVITNRKSKEVIGYIETLIWNEKDFASFEEISNFPIHYNIRGTSLYIIFVAVSKSKRGNGYGKLLISEIETQAKNFGIRSITLVAKDDLIQFYESIGYKQVKELPEFLKNRDYKSMKMQKEI